MALQTEKTGESAAQWRGSNSPDSAKGMKQDLEKWGFDERNLKTI